LRETYAYSRRTRIRRRTTSESKRKKSCLDQKPVENRTGIAKGKSGGIPPGGTAKSIRCKLPLDVVGAT
jgi:hypothetical protein